MHTAAHAQCSSQLGYRGEQLVRAAHTIHIRRFRSLLNVGVGGEIGIAYTTGRGPDYP
jgi:hypothetical protein